jgi:hypothetical protein
VRRKSLKPNPAEREFMLDVDREQLKTLPSSARDKWPQTLDRAWLTDVYAKYGEKPYGEARLG